MDEHEEHNNPLIRYELPYSFDVAVKHPRRRRNQAEDADAVAPRPHKAPRTIPDRANRVLSAAPQSAGPSGQGQLSSGDSRGPTNNTSSHSNESFMRPVDSHHPSPLMDVAMPSHQPAAAASEGVIDGGDPVLEGINPNRGSTTGGMEIWIEGSNFPTGSLPLYARFGDNSSRAVGILLVSFDYWLINPRLYENLACFFRVRCHQPMFQVRLQSPCLAARTQTLLLWVKVFVDSNTS